MHRERHGRYVRPSSCARPLPIPPRAPSLSTAAAGSDCPARRTHSHRSSCVPGSVASASGRRRPSRAQLWRSTGLGRDTVRLTDKVGIVVGAGQTPGDTIGNGRAAALLFAREGAKVLLVDRNVASAEETATLIAKEGGTSRCLAGDWTRVSDPVHNRRCAPSRWRAKRENRLTRPHQPSEINVCPPTAQRAYPASRGRPRLGCRSFAATKG